jgi:hypothetical protein
MNNTILKQLVETLQNINIPFQLKKQNINRNGIDNLAIKNNNNLQRVFLFLKNSLVIIIF